MVGKKSNKKAIQRRESITQSLANAFVKTVSSGSSNAAFTPARTQSRENDEKWYSVRTSK